MNRTNIFYFVMCLILSVSTNAAPYMGNTVKLKQPDGTKVSVRVFGDEYYQHIETPDGYTLVQDIDTGWITYATLSSDGKSLVSTGTPYFAANNSNSAMPTPSANAVVTQPSRAKLPGTSIRQIARENRYLLEPAPEPGAQPSASPGGNDIYTAANGLGSFIGLTLPIQFPDETGNFSHDEIVDFVNGEDYEMFNNNGSVREYFYDVSEGLLDYYNIVAPHYTAKFNKAYYTDPKIPYGKRARELITEALQYLEQQGFDFSQLSTNDYGTILAINVLYSGEVDTGWSRGLWPHKGSLDPIFEADGVSAYHYQITNMGDELTIGTFCHENGHLLLEWPDLYDYDTGLGSSGIGHYGLMAGGNLVASGKNPTPPNPYLRSLAGWEWSIDINNEAPGTVLSLNSNTNKSYRYVNDIDPNEFFIIESRIKRERNAALPDEGLMIWHIDRMGNNRYDEMEANYHFMVSLEQADGKYELEIGRSSGSGDLFHAGYADSFDDTTTPDAHWWNGSDSGLTINNISEVGDVMEFTLGVTPPANTDIVVSEPPAVQQYQCSFNVINEWSSGFVATIRITNNSDTYLRDWQVLWTFPGESVVTSGWNAQFAMSSPYAATPPAWYQGIAPGQSYEFGFSGSKSGLNTPLSAPTIFGSTCGG